MKWKDCFYKHWFSMLICFLFSSSLLAQRTVTGTIVSDKDNLPVASATVTAKGTNVSTLSDSAGQFRISVPANVNSIVISSVGYATQEISASSSAVTVTLKEITSSLDEVVVTGYTTQRKRDITGAVSVINTADLKSIPTIDAQSQLQGRASGVTVTQNGVPGASAKVRIRGLGSFNNNNPLYVVDGVQTGSITGLNPNDIESMQVLKDAASASIYGVRASNGVIVITTKKGKKKGVSVSLDAYGGFQNPGNGYDLLNAQEEGQLTFLTRTNSGQPTTGTAYGNGTTPVVPDYIWYTGSTNSASSATPIMAGNPGVDPSLYSLDPSRLGDAGYVPYLIVPASKPGTNWFKAITRKAPLQNYNVSVSGAGDASRFLLSLDYFDQNAITQYQYYKRYTMRLNSEFTVLKLFRIGENFQLYSADGNTAGQGTSGDNNNNQENSIIAETYRPKSITPVYNLGGDFGGTLGFNGAGTWGNAKNPLAQLYRAKDNRNRNTNILGNVYAEIDLFKHLTARSSFGVNFNDNSYFTNPFIEYEHNENTGNSTYGEGFIRNFGWITTNQLNYKNTFGNDHSLNVLVGEEARKDAGRQVIASSTGFFEYNYLPYINLNNGATPTLSGSGPFTPVTTVSYFAKADYAFQGKYLVSALIRRDGSSKFVGDNQYGNFPAFSVGWRISGENFMHNISWINDLKLRGSYGKTGNEAALSAVNGFSTFQSNPQSSNYDINGTQTSAASGFYNNFIGNPAGTWEKNVSTNIGFDATLFKNSTNIVFDWYKKDINGLLFNAPRQAILGAAVAQNPAFYNVGSMENHGIDVLVSNNSNLTKDLQLNVTATFTTYKNKITAVNGAQTFFEFNSPANEQNRIGSPITRNMVGQPLNTYFGYKVLGLFQSADEVSKAPTQTDAAPGRFRYADINGDGKIDADDRMVIGNPNPDFTYGFNLGLTYKAFDFTAFFYGSSGADAFNFERWWTDFSPGAFPGGRSKHALYDSWLPDGSRPNAKTPIQEVSQGSGFSTYLAVNSYYVENDSYFRLRNLQLGFTIPASVTQKVKIARARIYVQATNLFTITKYTGLDPDITVNDDRGANIDVGSYPLVQQYIVGANISF